MYASAVLLESGVIGLFVLLVVRSQLVIVAFEQRIVPTVAGYWSMKVELRPRLRMLGAGAWLSFGAVLINGGGVFRALFT